MNALARCWIAAAVGLLPATTWAQVAEPTGNEDPFASPESSVQPAEAEPQRDAGPFSKGRILVSLLLGGAFGGDRNYLILGAGAGYYVVDGLEVGLDGTIWLLDEPLIGTLTPQAKYVFHFVPVLKPYVGTFYRHYFVGDDFGDLDSVGARAGANIVMGGGGSYTSYIGLGAIYEHMLDCNEAVLDCDSVYPEFSFGFSF